MLTYLFQMVSHLGPDLLSVSMAVPISTKPTHMPLQLNARPNNKWPLIQYSLTSQTQAVSYVMFIIYVDKFL